MSNWTGVGSGSPKCLHTILAKFLNRRRGESAGITGIFFIRSNYVYE